MKKIVILSFFLLIFSTLKSQKYDIKGILTDTLGESLIAATVMLMDRDSTLIEFN